MRLTIDVALDYAFYDPADVLLQIEVAAMADQKLLADTLSVTSRERLRATPGEEAIGQRCWALGEGHFAARYHGEVEINREVIDIAALGETRPRDLPALVVPYLMASRYCQADKFDAFVQSDFAGLSGGPLAAAIRDWVGQHLTYRCGTSSGVTTAVDTFVTREGVCRDYAHLTAALMRAGGIPARCVGGYAPNVSPQDFHAVVEVWLADAWHLVDTTGMASAADFARVGVGRDATDIAFMTIFGRADLMKQSVRVTVG